MNVELTLTESELREAVRFYLKASGFEVISFVHFSHYPADGPDPPTTQAHLYVRSQP